MSTWVIDIEGNGLVPTKLYCLVAKHVVTKEKVLVNTHEGMAEFLLSRVKLIIGHNFTLWDILQLERLLKVKIQAKIYDTLAMSWYLFPTRKKHGLEEWGEEFGIPKPEIDDWENLSQEEYEHRCSEDVEINFMLWEKCKTLMRKIYGSDKEIVRFLDYLAFKMDCVKAQVTSKWKLDIEMTTKTLEELTLEREERFAQLSEVMPPVEHKEVKMAPAKMYKKDGSLSTAGQKWVNLCRFVGEGDDYPGPIEIVKKTEPGNPGSHAQIKNWLYSLGWVPTIIKYDRDKTTGDLKEIPQVRDSKSGEICEHIQELSEEVPELKLLVGLSVIGHRIPMLEGFLKNVNEEGYIEATVQGLTNTLRFKHRTVVNLPKIDRPYGDKIRGVLTSIDGWELCGADMSSLEDRLKHHFLYVHDPKYVEAMSRDDYDPHLALAVMANMCSEDDSTFYKYLDNQEVMDRATSEEKIRFKVIKSVRGIAKNGNYACQYGAGAARIALTAGISKEQAEIVHKGYWDLNWAIRAVAKEQIVIEVEGQKWLKNPINGFFYSLREEKDRFSTLVQGSASYVFDLWVMNFRNKRPQLTAQFHDEIVITVKEGYRDQVKKLLLDAIDLTNRQLNLNRELGIGIQFGKRYSEIH